MPADPVWQILPLSGGGIPGLVLLPLMAALGRGSEDTGGFVMLHQIDFRVYYEDTDLAGIVYYANYLKYIERARTEFVRALGVDQVELKNRQGVVFAVRKVEAEYLQPARFDDVVTVKTAPRKATGARIVLAQDVWRGEELLFRSVVTLVALGEAGKPARIPAELRRVLSLA